MNFLLCRPKLIALVAILCSCVAWPVCRSSHAQEVVEPNQVRRLVRDLEADRLEDRDAAERALVALGAEVVPLLPAIDASTSGELKIRLQRIRQSFDDQSMQAFFRASTVTLSGTMSLSEAIREISLQTGNQITLQGEDGVSGAEVTLQAEEAPFWEVMDSVLAQANLRINAFGATDSSLVLAPGATYNAETPQAFYKGPFRIDVLFVQATRRFGVAMDGQLQVSVQLSWEPRLQPVYVQIPMSSIEAKIGEDEVLASVNPAAAPEIPLNYGGCSAQIDLQLERPARSVSSIASLAGELIMAVPSEKHEYQFTKFANGARQMQEFGEVKVLLEGARRNGKVYEMRLRVQMANAQGALDSFRGWVLSNEAYMLDPNGNRVENLGFNTYAMTEDSVGIAYLFQINGDPDDFTLVYVSPASVSKQAVQYRLNEIILP